MTLVESRKISKHDRHNALFETQVFFQFPNKSIMTGTPQGHLMQLPDRPLSKGIKTRGQPVTKDNAIYQMPFDGRGYELAFARGNKARLSSWVPPPENQMSHNDELEAKQLSKCKSRNRRKIFVSTEATCRSPLDAFVPDLVLYRSRKRIKKGTKRRHRVIIYHQEDWPPPPLGLP